MEKNMSQFDLKGRSEVDPMDDYSIGYIGGGDEFRQKRTYANGESLLMSRVLYNVDDNEYVQTGTEIVGVFTRPAEVSFISAVLPYKGTVAGMDIDFLFSRPATFNDTSNVISFSGVGWSVIQNSSTLGAGLIASAAIPSNEYTNVVAGSTLKVQLAPDGTGSGSMPSGLIIEVWGYLKDSK